MARVKRGSQRTQKRKKILKQTKGFSAGRKNLTRQAKTAAKKAGQRAYDHRKLKKRTRRALWQVKINAGARLNGMSYSKFMGGLTKKNIEIDRKILADLAENHPKAFAKIVAEVGGDSPAPAKPAAKKEEKAKPAVKKEVKAAAKEKVAA